MTSPVVRDKGQATSVNAVAFGSAIGILIVVVLGMFGLSVPGESSAIFTGACGTIAGYLLR